MRIPVPSCPRAPFGRPGAPRTPRPTPPAEAHACPGEEAMRPLCRLKQKHLTLRVIREAPRACFRNGQGGLGCSSKHPASLRTHVRSTATDQMSSLSQRATHLGHFERESDTIQAALLVVRHLPERLARAGRHKRVLVHLCPATP